MSAQNITTGSLVIYKGRPARIQRASDRLEILLPDGSLAKVRQKDVILLHLGAMQSLNELGHEEGELFLAWEILSEDPLVEHDISELADIIFGAYTPASAFATWQILEDGLYFQGSPDKIRTRTPEQVAQEQEKRQQKAAEALAWEEFMQRARQGEIRAQDDAHLLRETEDLAFGRRADSLLLRELGHHERPENAHRLLLECEYWDESVNPHPVRLNLPSTAAELPLPALPDEERLDLTHLAAFAIDDQDNRDPDDALSLIDCQFDSNGNLTQGRLWVHIADGAALVPPDSPLDLDARGRGATLYLPEGAVPMLPKSAIQKLGLGLNEISPALSFMLTLNAQGEIMDMTFQPSWVKVQRMSYLEADKRIETSPFLELEQITRAYQARRKADGAYFIDMPEVIIKAQGKEVDIRPVLRLRSRDMVRESMIMAGEAAAGFASLQGLPFPFVTQSVLDSANMKSTDKDREIKLDRDDSLPDYAAFYALRRTLMRSQISTLPALHAGLGLAVYSRVTSPIRRYLDLAAHQQLRLFLQGKKLIQETDLLERLGASEALSGVVAQAEFQSRRHWTLVYLKQHPGYECEAILIDKQKQRGRLLIPELALEVDLHLREEKALNNQFRLKLKGVNLPELEAHFSII